MPLCNAHTNHLACAAAASKDAVCHWCWPPGMCYEKALWDCPREPKCFRNWPENLAIDPVAPSVFLLAIVCFVVFSTFSFFWWWWRPATHHHDNVEQCIVNDHDHDHDDDGNGLIVDVDMERSLLHPTSTNDHDMPDHIVDIAQHTQRKQRRYMVFKLAITCCCTPIILCSCILLLLSVPTAPTFDVCDTRWAISTLQKFEIPHDGDEPRYGPPDTGLRIKAEIHVSVFNPNRFDIDLSRADGVLTFHKGAIARFSWASRETELTPLPAGTVFDARIIVTVEKLNVLTVEELVEDLIKPSGIVLQLNANFYISLRLGPIPLTPRLGISDPGILLILNQADDTYCKCRATTV